jgi:hypothetical protein
MCAAAQFGGDDALISPTMASPRYTSEENLHQAGPGPDLARSPKPIPPVLIQWECALVAYMGSAGIRITSLNSGRPEGPPSFGRPILQSVRPQHGGIADYYAVDPTAPNGNHRRADSMSGRARPLNRVDPGLICSIPQRCISGQVVQKLDAGRF